MDLKEALQQWRERWKSDWEKNREKIEKELEENRERIKRGEKIEGLKDLLGAGVRASFTKVTEEIKKEKFEEFIKWVEGIKEDDLLKNKEAIIEEFSQWKKSGELQKIEWAGRHVLMSIAGILRPDIFIFGGHAIDAAIKKLLNKKEVHTEGMIEFITKWITEIPKDERMEALYYLCRYGRELRGKSEENEEEELEAPLLKLGSIIKALETKPFLILAGVSGTGKTQIARIIASVMSEEEE